MDNYLSRRELVFREPLNVIKKGIVASAIFKLIESLEVLAEQPNTRIIRPDDEDYGQAFLALLLNEEFGTRDKGYKIKGEDLEMPSVKYKGVKNTYINTLGDYDRISDKDGGINDIIITGFEPVLKDNINTHLSQVPGIYRLRITRDNSRKEDGFKYILSLLFVNYDKLVADYNKGDKLEYIDSNNPGEEFLNLRLNLGYFTGINHKTIEYTTANPIQEFFFDKVVKNVKSSSKQKK